MIFQSLRRFSSVIQTKILFYLFCFQSVSSLADINIGFINFIVHFDSPSLVLKRFILRHFKSLRLIWYVVNLFTFNSYESFRWRSLSNGIQPSLRSRFRITEQLYSSADSFTVSFAGLPIVGTNSNLNSGLSQKAVKGI